MGNCHSETQTLTGLMFPSWNAPVVKLLIIPGSGDVPSRAVVVCVLNYNPKVSSSILSRMDVKYFLGKRSKYGTDNCAVDNKS